MSDPFFDSPILNSPYLCPGRHWELDADGQPTGHTAEGRRKSALVTPVPKPEKRRQNAKQTALLLGAEDGLSSAEQEYNPTPIINEVRSGVEAWRNLPNPDQWKVTPETARLLQYWRHHPFDGVRPFFCQIEAVETAIWLAEVAPNTKQGARFLAHLRGANAQANPALMRLALKLATGAGKTAVMAMLIAWQTVNAVRHPQRKSFSKGFLVVTPGITIRDRLRVLLPNDPENYYRQRALVPQDMLGDIAKAQVVITNYHAFRRREVMKVAKGARAVLEGWRKKKVQTIETEGQMLHRVMPGLMGMGKPVMVLNDEAHHCYRERMQDTGGAPEDGLKGEDKTEARENNKAARLWISGLEAVKRKLGIGMVHDLSATPFFLRGSGYAEGTLFPWTMSDFSLMDAIECGIVKLPRVPVADNVPEADMPRFRNLWDHIGKELPRKGRAAAKTPDWPDLPGDLIAALDALYGHYKQTFAAWQKAGSEVPPVFIVVCNNTATSSLVYRYIAGLERQGAYGIGDHLELFRNHDESGNPLPRSRTILIDSAQLESGEALDKDFRSVAKAEIAQFKREMAERGGAGGKATENPDDATLLREVMNTVGKKGKLGEQVRCVVSVSMLTEGWDAQTVTHVLGVRAFGTQLLCEQVVGRALRRQSYEVNDKTGLFNVEYADILGIPFDFTAKPVVAPVMPPRPTVHVHAVPERAALGITFPRVRGYRIQLPDERLEARFNPDHVLELTPELVGPTETRNEGIVGTGTKMTPGHLKEDVRSATIAYHLAATLLWKHHRDSDDKPEIHLFGQLKRIARQWLDGGWLRCIGGTQPAQLLYPGIMEMAARRIRSAIIRSVPGDALVKAVLDAHDPTGSTASVNFTTPRKDDLWTTDPRKCHVNHAVLDSSWEREFCRVVEANPHVHAYVKNHGLGFEVPWLMGSTPRTYLPDFIVQVDDGRPGDRLNLIVEVKGKRDAESKEKANTVRTRWLPGVNNLHDFGRWDFAEFTNVNRMQAEFDTLIAGYLAAAARDKLVAA